MVAVTKCFLGRGEAVHISELFVSKKDRRVSGKAANPTDKKVRSCDKMTNDGVSARNYTLVTSLWRKVPVYGRLAILLAL